MQILWLRDTVRLLHQGDGDGHNVGSNSKGHRDHGNPRGTSGNFDDGFIKSDDGGGDE